MKLQELKNLNADQLTAELFKLREDLANIQVKTRSNQQKNVREGKKLKKDIARILTLLTVLRSQAK